jgi:calcineurin-like phosphoesterase family protein
MPRPSLIWLTTDTHFFHDKMVEACERPEDFTERILKNWRHLVAPQDEVIHLGDVIFYRTTELKSILDSLPGLKALVMGNHDRKSRGWYMRNGFAFAADSIRLGDVLLNHRPVTALSPGVRICIHGHLHNLPHHDDDPPRMPHNRLLAIEDTGYKPVRLDLFSR